MISREYNSLGNTMFPRCRKCGRENPLVNQDGECPMCSWHPGKPLQRLDPSAPRDPGRRLNPLPGYEDVAEVLDWALSQTQSGKGKQRHATNEAFKDQEIMQNCRKCGMGAMTHQIRKKCLEAQRLAENGEYEKAMADVLGDIIYSVALYLRIVELKEGSFTEKNQKEG